MSKVQTHDPKEFIRGIQQILISDTKRIGFLSGAGTSISIKKGGSPDSKIPGVVEMTQIVLSSIDGKLNQEAIKIIQEELTEKQSPVVLEYILSEIAQKELVVGKNKLCGLDKAGLNSLKSIIENKIKELVSVHKNEDNFLDNLLHADFAEWIGHASRKSPIEIFTTNYDYLFEIGLEKNNIQYFDGFIGGYKPFFDPTSVEDLKLLPHWTKLWKLHGSLGWAFDDKSHKIYRTIKDDSTIMIYPSILKYDNSRKQPYLSFLDRLSNFIKEDDGVLFICGYSFGDMHINDTILNALKQTNTSHVIVLFYDEFDDKAQISTIAKNQPNLSVYGKRKAIIGGIFGDWQLKVSPSVEDTIQIDAYFDEDATEPAHPWTGKGDFRLVDFAKFVDFLKTLHYENYRMSI